jgi:hypothetical protein
MNVRLGWLVGEIHNDKITHISFVPAPGKYILVALVVRPACPVTQVPFTTPKNISIDLIQKNLKSYRSSILHRATTQNTGNLTFLPLNCPHATLLR